MAHKHAHTHTHRVKDTRSDYVPNTVENEGICPSTPTGTEVVEWMSTRIVEHE